VVVNDLDILGTGSAPSKTDARLLIDADAVLARPVALELLQSVPRSNARISQGSIDVATPRLRTSPPNIAYELPTSVGGNLNSTPIGVQEIVTNALSEAQAAGRPINSAATRDVALANAAHAAKNYANAYTLFQESYQAM